MRTPKSRSSRKNSKPQRPLVAKLQAKINDARYLAKAPEKQRSQDREKLKSYGDKAAAARAAIKSWGRSSSRAVGTSSSGVCVEEEDDPAAAKALEAKAKAMAKLAKKEANQRSGARTRTRRPEEADQDLKALYVRQGVRF